VDKRVRGGLPLGIFFTGEEYSGALEDVLEVIDEVELRFPAAPLPDVVSDADAGS
jgi:hypothetical protein